MWVSGDLHLTHSAHEMLAARPRTSYDLRQMPLVVFLRGVNVGGHRRFRPSVLADQLRDHDVVNIGATGTFVVRRPGSRQAFRALLARRLPFDAQIAICDGRDLLRLRAESPFANQPSRPDVTRFVSILAKPSRRAATMPILIPPDGEWFVRIVGARKQFIVGEYRRHMKTIGYLGQIDKLFGAKATTRTWKTIEAILRVLEGESASTKPGRR